MQEAIAEVDKYDWCTIHDPKNIKFVTLLANYRECKHAEYNKGL